MIRPILVLALAVLPGCVAPTTQTRLTADLDSFAMAQDWLEKWVAQAPKPSADTERVLRQALEAWRLRLEADRASLGTGR